MSQALSWSTVVRVVRAVARSTHLPVTVKVRSGWSEEMRSTRGFRLRRPLGLGSAIPLG